MAKKHPKKLKNKYLLLLPLVVVVGFLTWLIIRVSTMDTEIRTVIDYTIPEGNSLEGVAAVGYGDVAVAIDGFVADSSSRRQTANDENTDGSGTGESPAEANVPVRPTASTAKMISALAIMRTKPFSPGETGETITITADDYNIYDWYYTHNGSNTRVRVGEEISEYDALASMLLASSNNMADTLATWAFGSLDSYREYATNMLSELGATHTTIGPDASGYDAGTTSTAEDLARIGYFVMKEPVLREIVGTKSRDVPVAGTLTNTNGLLGIDGISGIKTGYIGDASGYCLVSGYETGEHIVTVSLLGAPSRAASFDDSLAIVRKLQSNVPLGTLIEKDTTIGHYEMWWDKNIPIKTTETMTGLNWRTEQKSVELNMQDEAGELKIQIGDFTYSVPVTTDEYRKKPSLLDKIKHAFGWSYNNTDEGDSDIDNSIDDNTNPGAESNNQSSDSADAQREKTPEEILAEENANLKPITAVPSDNYTINFGYLMLINPNFTVNTSFIDARKAELVSISSLYGIVEGNPYNGDNLLDPEAATHIHEMVEAYKAEYPGHTLETRSCYRARGTTCGRLCAATGASDHHTGLTCDLLDPAYGTSLDTDTYAQHIDWQWLKANSYKYGFIDRFPEAWAGGPMSAPLNVDENGSTGLFETWHYRYVGIGPATEIATGKYNNGKYDSLEHYLKMRGLISDLKNGH